MASVCLLLAVGCGGGQAAPPPANAGPSPAAPTAAEGRPPEAMAVDWVDPEPEGAQEKAEEVADAEWNRDKTIQLSDARTSRLTMSMTTLVGRTSALDGFSTSVEREASSLDDRLAGLGADVSGTEISIRLPGAILFDFDSATIRPDAHRTLDEVVAVLAELSDHPVRLEGHTDSIASEAYNRELSERRAEAVASWLSDRGIDPSRLSTVGKGESEPVADNSTAEGRQQNRRVTVVIAK